MVNNPALDFHGAYTRGPPEGAVRAGDAWGAGGGGEIMAYFVYISHDGHHSRFCSTKSKLLFVFPLFHCQHVMFKFKDLMRTNFGPFFIYENKKYPAFLCLAS